MKFLGILAVLGLVTIESASGAACDATTGASVKVKSITTTQTSAVITYTEGHANGKRNFQYGIGTLGPIQPVQTRNRSAHPETITGLTPNSTYKYLFSGVWGGRSDKSLVTGTFKTDGSSCGELIATTGKVEGNVLNHSNDAIQNVAVSVEDATKIVATDTTDENGYYSFELKPGSNYKLKCAYPPFIAPAPATIPAVTIGKTNKLPNQILTGAYQLSATVKDKVGGVGVDKAVVTIKHKTDAAINYSAITNEEGQFSLGVKAGEYSIMVVSGTKTLREPIIATVTAKSVVMTELILSSTIGIKILPKLGKSPSATNSTYNAKGAHQGNHSVNQNQVIRFSK